MTPQTYNFKQQKSGDTFMGVIIKCTNIVNGEEIPIDLTDCEIKMQVKLQKCLNPIIDLSIGNGIELTQPLLGEFFISNIIIPEVKSYNYIYDIQINFPSGIIKTYIEGNFPIISDVTR